MAIWGGLTNSWKKKRSEKQRIKGKLYPFECRIPKDSKKRQESLPQWSVQRNREKQYIGTSTLCEMWTSNVQAGFRKGRGSRDQIANIHWIIEKAREFQKTCFFFIDYAKAFDCVDHHKVWKILKEIGISDHLTCLLRNLYAGQEATVRNGHGKTDWFQIGKGVHQGCILSPCLFNLCAESIMRNTGLDEWSTSWNRDFWEKYQQPEMCRWHHPYGRKWRRTKETLESETEGLKSWPEAQRSEN